MLFAADGHEPGGASAGGVSAGVVEREVGIGGTDAGAGGANDVGTGGADDAGVGGTNASTRGEWLCSYLGRGRSGGDDHHRRAARCQ
jgi:hypothetical protein